MFITNILLFLSFSPFVFLSLLVPNMVAAMVTGAAFSIGNLMISSTKYAPYFPWSSSYLIGANEIANYSCNTATSLAIILATFAIGLTISYIYFTKKDVCL
jgi:hypothetical protein